MNLLEAVSYLRLNILDDTGGVGVDWVGYDENAFGSLQFRWQNEELVSNINSAITKASRNISPVESIWKPHVKKGTNTTDIPTYIQKILAMKNSSGKPLLETSIQDHWMYEDSETKTGTIVGWIPDYKSRILRTYDINNTAGETLTALVYTYPKNDYTWAEDQFVTLELEDYMLQPMLYYAAHLCYLKDEANTYDPNRAATLLVLFEKEFPHTSVYSTMRKQRTTNRPIKYGGY